MCLELDPLWVILFAIYISWQLLYGSFGTLLVLTVEWSSFIHMNKLGRDKLERYLSEPSTQLRINPCLNASAQIQIALLECIIRSRSPILNLRSGLMKIAIYKMTIVCWYHTGREPGFWGAVAAVQGYLGRRLETVIEDHRRNLDRRCCSCPAVIG